jgi:hypothetical protein
MLLLSGVVQLELYAAWLAGEGDLATFSICGDFRKL